MSEQSQNQYSADTLQDGKGLDDEGFIINPTSLEKVQAEYKAVLSEAIAVATQRFPDGIYIVLA